jgi:membrane-associated phospholipid phosphatase
LNNRKAVFNEFARATVFLLVEFIVVFYGTDFLAGEHSNRLKLYFDWETKLPFEPLAYTIYFSVFVLPFLVAVVARDVEEVRVWKNRMAITIAISGLIFVLAPAELGYAAGSDGGWLSDAATIICGRYNLLPSLHVGLTAVIAGSLLSNLGKSGRIVIVLWAAALMLSTLLTHQHHVMDVVAGLALGLFVCRLIPAPGRVRGNVSRGGA